eukprot:s2805_g9.t1
MTSTPRRSKGQSVRRRINRPADLQLQKIFFPKVLHLLFLLAVDQCLDLNQLILKWPRMTPGQSNDGRYWPTVDDCKDHICPRINLKTHPALGRALAHDQAPHPRLPWLARTALTVPLDQIFHPPRHIGTTLATTSQWRMMMEQRNQEAGATPAWTWRVRPWHRAIETLLGMYRNHLSPTAMLTNREMGGRVGGLRRHLHFKQWSYVSRHARSILDGEDLASWRTFEHRATHEYRPHRRPADNDD